MALNKPSTSMQEFLSTLSIDIEKIDTLYQLFLETIEDLAANSENQFLPTPISESLLRPNGQRRQGW